MGSPWKAVADDSRRQMLVLLKKGEQTPSEIAEHFSFTKPALSTHLRILSEAGLVSERKVGRNRLYSVRKDAMTEMMEFFDSFWEDKLIDLKRHVETKQIRNRATSK
ncbi:MAG TPA: metalloregulator ArsR/SmtB family transcription factor [Terriglobales bacterium]|nr:metalloregulator ArsR/SmtB family transcription factor [Terriglobales bacterium]